MSAERRTPEPAGATQATAYVDRILKGEKPVELSAQAPTKYGLAINLKTERAAAPVGAKRKLGWWAPGRRAQLRLARTMQRPLRP
jgi:hypothetical protein